MYRITSEKVFTAGLTCPKLWGSIKSESSPTSEAITRRSGCINNLAGQSAACLHADYHIKRISGSSTDGPIQMQTISCNIYKDKQPTTEAAQLPHWAVRVTAETGISPECGAHKWLAHRLLHCFLRFSMLHFDRMDNSLERIGAIMKGGKQFYFFQEFSCLFIECASAKLLSRQRAMFIRSDRCLIEL